ncbi:MAG: ATP-dependent DNA helicase [Desulfurivibrio sp.]
MAEIFSADGILARHLPDYEARAGQLTMAQAVARTLDPEEDHPGEGQTEADNRLLMVEAGTGTGKTLAYLVPAVLSGRRVVISTNTINLQEQILAKEIPFIRRYLAPWLKALCVKGRQNYLCLHRWHQLLAAGRQGRLFAGHGATLAAGDEELALIGQWLEETEQGDRAELKSLADDSPLWQGINAATGHCPGSSCPHAAECFITRLRQRAARAHLLIVNHHLFFSDLAVRRSGHAEVLPRYEAVIFDEAHHLENIATRHFGLGISHYQIIDLVRDLEGMAEERLRDQLRSRLLQTARALAVEADLLRDFFPPERGRFPLIPLLTGHPAWPGTREGLENGFMALGRLLEELSRAEEIWNPLLRRNQELADTFRAIVEPLAAEETAATTPESIHWYERREKTVQLAASPIDIAPHLQQNLYQQVKAAVFTSATLRTGNDFRYVKSRLGLPEQCLALALDTPFNYPRRTLLYVPGADFPLPGAANHPGESQRVMREIIGLSRGRALLLFTSVSAMRQTAAALTGTVPYPILVQGDAPRSVLLEQFRRKTRSILLAVASFWEGVDVPGESLSCVIIDKLPFEVPSDPVIMARIDKIRADGGNPFFDFQVPRAVLMLRQGVGRLMRSASDRGVLAILDIRLFSKGYGKIFRRSLPPSPISRELAQVKDFFNRENNR